MSRFIFWLVLAGVIYGWWRTRVQSPPPAPPPAEPAPAEASLSSMVECARCHLHLPSSEALLAPDGRSYCCEAHRDAEARGTG